MLPNLNDIDDNDADEVSWGLCRGGIFVCMQSNVTKTSSLRD